MPDISTTFKDVFFHTDTTLSDEEAWKLVRSEGMLFQSFVLVGTGVGFCEDDCMKNRYRVRFFYALKDAN